MPKSLDFYIIDFQDGDPKKNLLWENATIVQLYFLLWYDLFSPLYLPASTAAHSHALPNHYFLPRPCHQHCPLDVHLSTTRPVAPSPTHNPPPPHVMPPTPTFPSNLQAIGAPNLEKPSPSALAPPPSTSTSNRGRQRPCRHAACLPLAPAHSCWPPTQTPKP